MISETLHQNKIGEEHSMDNLLYNSLTRDRNKPEFATIQAASYLHKPHCIWNSHHPRDRAFPNDGGFVYAVKYDTTEEQI